MNNVLRLSVVGGLIAFAVLAVALGLARNDAELLAPFHLLFFAVVMLAYLLPTFLAYYRNCQATIWIAVVNVLLGWTLFGWVVALGWAARGKVTTLPPTAAPPPAVPVLGR